MPTGPKASRKGKDKGRKSSTANALSQCTICKVIYSSAADEDGCKHAEVCKVESKFNPEKLLKSEDLAYGFLFNGTLIATTLIVKGKLTCESYTEDASDNCFSVFDMRCLHMGTPG